MRRAYRRGSGQSAGPHAVRPDEKHVRARFHAAILTVMLLLPVAAAGGVPEFPAATAEQMTDWQRYQEEHAGHRLLLDFAERHKAETRVFTGGTVVPMTGNGPFANATLVVRDGRFAAVGPSAETSAPDGVPTIDLGGLFIIPGLTEGHAHTIDSLGQFLVYLTRGVTSLREMDGFPWMLEARRIASNGDLLTPNLYVAGHILAKGGWAFYMTDVQSPVEVRRVVQEQAAAGYDYIKIHNSFPEPLFSAVFEVAAEVGLDVVGHIPHGISVRQAVMAGMSTNEHFKGYIDDSVLQVSDEDFVAATRGSSLWNVPTFASYHDHLRGEAAKASLDPESYSLVPGWMRRGWERQAAKPVDDLTTLRQTILSKEKEIFRRLWPVTDRFFTGTDTGGYAFMVPGYTLHEEISIFASLGLTPKEALAAATIQAARGMGKESEFGSIEPGKRADFVVLEADPLDNPENLRRIAGVSVRGIWLDRAALDAIEDALRTAYADNTPRPILSSAAIGDWVSAMEELAARRFPYPDYYLESAAGFCRELGQTKHAARIEALR